MTTTLTIKCPCGAKMQVDGKHRGKVGRCKSCKNKFRVPAEKPTHNPAQSAAASAAASLLASASTAATKQPSSATKKSGSCPSCGKAMAGGSIVCIHCGYHTTLKRKLKQVVTDSDPLAQQPASGLIRLLAYMTAVVIISLSWLWHQGVSGPTYLVFYLSAFCTIALAIIALRKMYCDSDLFNHVALLTIGGMGTVRLIDALTNQNYRIIFLLLGMLVSVGVFLLSKTDWDSDQANPFLSSDGGLAVMPTAVLYGCAASVLAGVYFIQPIGDFVAQAGGIILVGIAAVIFTTSARLAGHEFESGGSGSNGGFFSGSSCSSCGSSCGGGGGCGGCGG